jgi:hypothetical protein
MRDAKVVAILVLTSPLWLPAVAICGILVAIGWGAGKLPIVGLPIFLVCLFLIVPFGSVALWVSSTVTWLGRDDIDIEPAFVRIRGKRRLIELQWSEVLRGEVAFEPPNRILALVRADGSSVAIHPMSDVVALVRELKIRGIPVQGDGVGA